MRILFWILGLAALGGFFFAAAHQNQMSDSANALVWGSVSFGAVAMIAFGTAVMLRNGWKKGSATMIGYHRLGTTYSRNEKPTDYWRVMFFWLIAFLLSLSTAGLSFLRLVHQLPR